MASSAVLAEILCSSAPRVLCAGDPVPVLFDVGGIDDQHIGLVLFEAIHDQVVHDPAGLVGKGAVLRLTGRQFRGIVGGDALDQVQGMFAFHDELAHMADIEDPGVCADGLVFVVDAAVADRHIVTGEFGHFCAKGQMERGEWRALHDMELSRKCRAKTAHKNIVPRQRPGGCVPTSTNESKLVKYDQLKKLDSSR